MQIIIIVMGAVIFSIFTFISTFVGGIVALKNQSRLHYIMSFSAGVVIAVSFFEIIPEAFSIAQSNRLNITATQIAIVLGFLVFHILEKSISLHHSHEEEYSSHKHPSVGIMGALGLSFHSFLDGLGIGIGFQVNAATGILIALAVIAHDFSDGLNTVTLMLSSKNRLGRAVAFLILDSLAPVLGVLSTFFFKVPQQFLTLYLGFFAGFLLYIGASDLLPEAHSQHSSYKMIGLTVAGVIFIFIVTRFV